MNARGDEVQLPRYLQLLWEREPNGRRGPRPGRNIVEIGRAGVDIADRLGLEAVSMKSVAAAVGMTPMSLYRYVDSKEQLLEVMLDVAYGPPDLAQASGPADIRAPEPRRWRARLAWWAYALAAALAEHPWISAVSVTTPPLSPNILGWTEAGARAFDGVTLTSQQKMSNLLVVDGYVRSHVRLSLSLGLLPGDGGQPSAEADEAYGMLLAALVDPERFPALTAAAPAMSDDDGDFYEDELAFGLGVVLDGIDALIHRS